MRFNVQLDVDLNYVEDVKEAIDILTPLCELIKKQRGIKDVIQYKLKPRKMK